MPSVTLRLCLISDVMVFMCIYAMAFFKTYSQACLPQVRKLPAIQNIIFIQQLTSQSIALNEVFSTVNNGNHLNERGIGMTIVSNVKLISERGLMTRIKFE